MFLRTRRRGRPPFPLRGCGIRRRSLRARRLAPAGDAHPPWALPGPRVRLRSLAPGRHAAAVSEAAVGADLGEPLDVLRALSAQIALDLARFDGLAKLYYLVVGEVLDIGVRIDADVVEDLIRGRAAGA